MKRKVQVRLPFTLTWHELAKVVETFDHSKAQEIRQRYCVGEERYEEGMNHCV